MTTVSIPMSTFTAQVAQEFPTPGDGLLSNFNLYYLGLQTDAGAGLVDVEIESIRVLLPGVAGDYDGNSHIDGHDFLVWQRTLGNTVAAGSGADGNNNGVVDAGDLSVWKTSFGTAAAPSAAAVPEPCSSALLLVAAAVVFRSRRSPRA
jgi:hypothetical protein